MIDDPVVLSTDSKQNEGKYDRSRDFFYIYPAYPEITLEVKGRVKFRVHIGCDWNFYVIDSGHGRHTTKEQCFDYIKTNYPDHFEWLLFHPEWL